MLLTAGVAGAWINTASVAWILGRTLHVSLAAGGLCLWGHLGPPRLPSSWPPPGEAAPATRPSAASGTPARGQCPIEGFRMPWIPTSLLCPAPPPRLLLPSLPSPNLSLFSGRVFPNPKAFCCSWSSCPAITPGWARCPGSGLAPRSPSGDAELYSVLHKISPAASQGDNNTQMLNRLLKPEGRLVPSNPSASGVGFQAGAPTFPFCLSLVCLPSNFNSPVSGVTLSSPCQARLPVTVIPKCLQTLEVPTT